MGGLKQKVPCSKLYSTSRCKYAEMKSYIHLLVSNRNIFNAQRKNRTDLAVPILSMGTGYAWWPWKTVHMVKFKHFLLHRFHELFPFCMYSMSYIQALFVSLAEHVAIKEFGQIVKFNV